MRKLLFLSLLLLDCGRGAELHQSRSADGEKETHYRGDSERHDARVLEKHSRRQHQGGARIVRAGN